MPNTETINAAEFPIRTYSKKELALLYFPNSKYPHTAVNHLMSWIRNCEPLWVQLQNSGYRKTSKFFNPRQVGLIVKFLGEPYGFDG